MLLRRPLQSPYHSLLSARFSSNLYILSMRILVILVHAIRLADAIKATVESLKAKDMKATIDNIIGAALIVVEAVNDLQHIPE